MQWLIDICVERVIDEIGIPPVYIDRGDPAPWDFILGDFTTDGAWHTLDLSAIVPAGASAVDIKFGIKDNLVGQGAYLARNGKTNRNTAAASLTQVSLIINYSNPTVPCDTDRKIQYFFTNTPWSAIYFIVKGWWL